MMRPRKSDDETTHRGYAASVREHGDIIALVGVGLVLVSTRVLSRDGHTPVTVGLIILGFLALVAPVFASIAQRID